MSDANEFKSLAMVDLDPAQLLGFQSLARNHEGLDPSLHDLSRLLSKRGSEVPLKKND
ncbi:MAG: hypothetical protein AB7S74_13215 [Hyphomicrobium sp.]